MTWAKIGISGISDSFMPVARVGETAIGDGSGPLTQKLNDLYWQKHSDPDWSTVVG